MKDNRPIRQQVEDLTEEQKAMLPKIRRNRAIILLLILAAMIAVFLYAMISCNRVNRLYQIPSGFPSSANSSTTRVVCRPLPSFSLI